MKQSGILQNNLVVFRAEKRWSQTDLANKAGVSRQTIASIGSESLQSIFNFSF